LGERGKISLSGNFLVYLSEYEKHESFKKSLWTLQKQGQQEVVTGKMPTTMEK
jgi:hypothetical protein